MSVAHYTGFMNLEWARQIKQRPKIHLFEMTQGLVGEVGRDSLKCLTKSETKNNDVRERAGDADYAAVE